VLDFITNIPLAFCHTNCFERCDITLIKFFFEAEMDVKKKSLMRSKVNEYIRRAEDLKRIIYAKEGGQLQSYEKIRILNSAELSM
jgi:hypothetical protein